MNTKSLFSSFVVACSVALSGCGGGGGGSTPMMPACFETAEFGCISASEYEEEWNRIVKTHRDKLPPAQWGLAAIQADQAYANLELAQGSDAKPGAGVTIGLIDTGIDTE